MSSLPYRLDADLQITLQVGLLNENQPDPNRVDVDDFKGRHGAARRKDGGTLDRDDRHGHVGGRDFAESELEELD